MIAKHRSTLVVGLAAILALALYLAWSWAQGHIGFPLDDAWIHLAYARNLAEYGEWAFLIGQPSTGSTAPLWTVMLALGYLMGIQFHAWAYLLGGLCLAATGLVAAELARQLFPGHGAAPILAGIACALEWHLVWAAAAGMETMLFALLALAIWYRLILHPSERPLLTGLLCGALILARPEGAMLVGLATLVPILAEGRRGRWRSGVAKAAILGLGTALLVGPYILLNLRLSGTPWPNTFYAKQAEYASHRLQPFLVRLWEVGRLPFVGSQMLLVPGLIGGLWHRSRPEYAGPCSQLVVRWLAVVWVAGTVMTYATLLPVTYQHGRYLMPVIPVILVLGVGGSLDLLHLTRRSVLARAITRTLIGSFAVLLLMFCVIIGAPQYATDVTIIEGEMVTTARWLAANTQPDALIAVHDIGAIGYYARRPMLDLAGLISPEVIPFIRDESALLEWMQVQGADYLVTFPSWYGDMTADPRVEQVFQTSSGVTIEQGGENMAVYSLNW